MNLPSNAAELLDRCADALDEHSSELLMQAAAAITDDNPDKRLAFCKLMAQDDLLWSLIGLAAGTTIVAELKSRGDVP